MAGDKDLLLGMGFDSARIDWAIKETKGAGFQPALDFLIAHADEPIPEPGATSSTSAGVGASDAMDEDDEESQALKEMYSKGAAGSSGEGSAEQVEAKSIKCMQCQKTFKNIALANFHAEKSGHDQFEESTDEIKPLTEEEKTARLAELRAKLAEKRAKKTEIEKEEAKANEKIRRLTGKDAGKIREELQAKETVKQAERARQDKLDDAKARAEIKRKIEEDKAERKARAEREKALREGKTIDIGATPAPAAAQPATSTSTREYDTARLQIRLASGGKPYITTLPSDAKLEEVAEFLAGQTLAVDVETVKFAMHYPKKEFQRSDFSKTLKELGLTPSAVLIAST